VTDNIIIGYFQLQQFKYLNSVLSVASVWNFESTIVWWAIMDIIWQQRL